jgi:hypothetical protein
MKPSSTEARPSLEFDLSWKIVDHSALGPLHLWSRRLEALWSYPVLESNTAQAALVLAMLLICALRAWIGLTGMQVFSHDAFMPLDGAWRLLNGQRPHIDFYSYIGVLAYLPTAAGLLLSHGGAQGFGYGQALTGGLLGLWAFLLARRRLSGLAAVLFCLAVVLLCTAPYALGYSPLDISPATTYNRYGYAALALILLEAVATRPGITRLEQLLGGVSTGSLIALLAFQKITFFGAALFLLGALAFCRTQTARRWAGIAMGFAWLTLGFCAYFGFRLMPMLRDLVMVAGGKRIHVRIYMLDSVFAEAAALAGFALLAALLLTLQNRPNLARSLGIAGAAVCSSGLLLILGNCEPHGAPLALFFVLIALSQFSFRASGATQLLRGGVLLWGTVFTVAALAPNALAFGYATALRITSAPRETPMAGVNLSSFVPVSNGDNYRVFVNDGLALLNAYRAPGDTVMSLDFTNPFSYGLGLKPARGGTTALHYQTTFNDLHRPTAEWLFGSANLVMVPKNFSDPTLQESIPRLYGLYLETHFRLLAESREWKLYRSRT